MLCFSFIFCIWLKLSQLIYKNYPKEFKYKSPIIKIQFKFRWRKKYLKEKLGIKKIETEKFLDTLEEIITEELKKGEDFTLGKLGTFKVKDRAEKNGVNPKTGEKIVIPARKAVTFKASKNLSTLIK